MSFMNDGASVTRRNTLKHTLNMSEDWNPHQRLDYEGPYSRYCLQKARELLIKCLKEGGGIIERVKPLIGIDSRAGRAYVPPFPYWTDVDNLTCCDEKEALGYGHSSQEWCHGQNHTSIRVSEALNTSKDITTTDYDDCSQEIEEYVTSKPDVTASPKIPVHCDRDNSSLHQTSHSPDLQTADHIDRERFRQTSCSPDLPPIGEIDQSRSSPINNPSIPAFFSGVSQRVSPETVQQRGTRRGASTRSATVSKPSEASALASGSQQLSEDASSKENRKAVSPIDKLLQNPKAMKIDIPENLKSVIKNLSGELSAATSSRVNTQNEAIVIQNRTSDNVNSVTQKRKYNYEDNDDYNNKHREFTTKRLKTAWSNVRNDNDVWQDKQTYGKNAPSVGEQGITINNANNSYSSKSIVPSRISVYRGPASQEGNNIIIQPDTGDVFRNTFLLYKCDFCLTTASSYVEINDHLISTQHFSASLYNARNISSGIELVSIAKMLAVKNTFSKSSILVVACPECKDMFEDIFMCALHAKYTHGGINGFYSICPIVDHQTVKISTAPICLAEDCNVTFVSHIFLHQHWNSRKAHHPLAGMGRESQHTFLIVICPFCHLTFRDNFIAAKMHAIRSHPREERNMTALQVKEVLQPRRREELPPLDTSKRGDRGCLVTELEILQNMTKHFNGMSGSKGKVQGIRQRINFLKNMLSNMGEGY